MAHQPLKTPVFRILLALTERDLHGLGIADRIEETADAAVTLGPGTLHRSLKEMVERGLVRETSAPEADADPRRKYYAVTALRDAMEDEEPPVRERAAWALERVVRKRVPGYATDAS